MKFPGFCGGSYEHPSLNVDAQRSINLYPETVQSGAGKGEMVLRRTPGLDLWATLPTTPVRGLWAGEDRLFAAGGTKLYEVSIGGTATEIGTIADDATHSPVQIFPNGVELFVISAGYAYVHDGVSLASAPVPADPAADPMSAAGTVGTAKTGAYMDGYFIAAKPDSKTFWFSALNDGETWDEVEFSSKNVYPDNIRSIVGDHQELWVFGTTVATEGWRNEGDADQAGGFRRDPSAVMHESCCAVFSPLSLAGGVAWLGGGSKGQIIAFHARGFQPKRVSTHAVEAVWKTYSTVADAISYSYVDDGHEFWVLTFPTGNATWVYDVSTNFWHQRASGSGLDRHRGRCHAFVFGKHLVGDYSNGKIYEMSSAFADDDGTAIVRKRRTPYIHDSGDYRTLFHASVQVDIDFDDELPEATLSWSDDGGRTFNTPVAAVPSLDDGLAVLEWRRLGRSQARGRVYELTIDDAVDFTISGASIRVVGGTRAA